MGAEQWRTRRELLDSHQSTSFVSAAASSDSKMPPKQVAGMSQKRIARELADLKKEQLPPGCTAGPRDESIFEWDATIGKHYSPLPRSRLVLTRSVIAVEGPPDSPYENGQFNLHITLPPDYPFRPPKVTFKTRIYHANINTQGGICRESRDHFRSLPLIS